TFGRGVMADIHIERLPGDQWQRAACVLAAAFVTNPVNVAAFGPSSPARNERFFQVALAAMKGPRLVATDGARILGLIHWVASQGCQLSGLEKLGMAPALAKAVGLRSAIRVAYWQSLWARHDPAEPHLHLGPLGVSPDAQGRGVGHRLMDAYCAELDRTGQAGYLETDRPENARFYSRFSFAITAEIVVLGVPNF